MDPTGNTLSPFVARRRLRHALRAARMSLRRTQEQVAGDMDWPLARLIRIESGTAGISAHDIGALAGYYGIDDQGQAELLVLGRLSRSRPWWYSYREDISPQLGELIDSESGAAIVRSFQCLLVPGLLQTAEYAHAVLARLMPHLSHQRRSRLVDVRMARQRMMFSDGAPEMSFIVDEAAVRRCVGGIDVTRRQVEHIVLMARQPHCSVHVVPLRAGGHPGMQGPFVLLDFTDEENLRLLYLEMSNGELISRAGAEEYAAYRDRFEQLRGLSLGSEQSVVFLTRIAGELS